MESRDQGLGNRGCGLEEVLFLTLLSAITRPTAASELPRAQVEHSLQVTVRVYNYAEVPQKTLSSAVEEARRIFQKGGVETDWVACLIGGAKPDPACEEHLGPAGIILKILPASMATRLDAHWEHLGFAASSATPSPGSDAWVFYRRVEELAKFRIADRELILSAAMAHEIGHLLLGLEPHSPSGIMRGKWHREDLMLLAQGYLLFTSKQSEQMRKAVTTRLQQAELTQRRAKVLPMESIAVDRK